MRPVLSLGERDTTCIRTSAMLFDTHALSSLAGVMAVNFKSSLMFSIAGRLAHSNMYIHTGYL